MAQGTAPETVSRLQLKSWQVAMYCNVHRDWQPDWHTSFKDGEPADMYLQPRKHNRLDYEPSLLKWSTASDIEAAIDEIRRRTFKEKTV